jgi:hypothetical protein
MDNIELATKRNIFSKYDFSKFSLIKKAGVDRNSPESELFHGIATIVQIILTVTETMVEQKNPDISYYKKMEAKVLKNYGRLQLMYQGIDWNELDLKDPDFEVFFRMKRLIEQLGQNLNPLLMESKKELRIHGNWTNYRKFVELIERIRETMQDFAEIRERLSKAADSNNGERATVFV